MGAAQYQLFPGIFLSYNLNTSEVPQMMLRSLETGNMNEEFDNYISDRLNQYLNSLTLNIKVLDPSTMHHARKLSNEIFSRLVPHETGRRKGHNNNAMWMAGTVAAVSVSALAAISGKALMTSLLALMLTGAKMMHKGGGGGGYGCKSAALIDARTMEIDRIAAAAETEFNQHIPIHVFTPSAHGQLTSYSGPPKH
ncbi:uncharacterized protein LOC106662562 [Cimex lectularius]|uniref:Uncharacterized protein n=1 Tax=Cimex lectularius TaxID=79782 RepID=A0A8I6RHL9_CIMLE|nr:uncharacterized protein LOC106662562 [Cimex lectularius]